MPCKCSPFVLCRNPCSRRLWEASFNGNPPKSPVLDDCAGLSTSLYDSLPPCRSMPSRSCTLVPSPVPRPHASSSTVPRTPGHHVTRRQVGAAVLQHPATKRWSLSPMYIRMPSNSACLSVFLLSIPSASASPRASTRLPGQPLHVLGSLLRFLGHAENGMSAASFL